MDEYYRVVKALPNPLSRELESLPPSCAPQVQEIRLRVGQPVQFTICGKLHPCAEFLREPMQATYLSAPFLQRCFMHLCQHSVYAYEEEISHGFLTIAGGNRIGVAGTRSHGGFSAITSLNMRIARWITCQLPTAVQEHLSAGAGGLLVAGPPGSGKTTFLRTLVQFLSLENRILCVVDERGELMASEPRGLPDQARLSCDVYTRCSKTEGIQMALRCMNPEYIICDELGTSADIAALEQGMASGANFLASVHCDTPESLQKKPQLQRLLQTGAFSMVAVLGNRKQPGKVTHWMRLP